MVLVGYWPLNESSGNTAYDHSRFGNDGTIYDGGDSTVPGANGILTQNAYNFDGNNDYVEIPHASQLFFTDSISASAWIYIDSLNEQKEIITLNQQIELSIKSSGELEPSVYTTPKDTWTQPTTSNTIALNKWVHIAMTYDRSNIVAYINGQREVLKSLNEPMDPTKDPKYIGKWYTDSQYFDGRISENRIYNHALTKQEIQYLYSVGKNGKHVSSKKQI